MKSNKLAYNIDPLFLTWTKELTSFISSFIILKRTLRLCLSAHIKTEKYVAHVNCRKSLGPSFADSGHEALSSSIFIKANYRETSLQHDTRACGGDGVFSDHLQFESI